MACPQNHSTYLSWLHIHISICSLTEPSYPCEQACCGEKEFGDASSIIDAPAATMKSKYTGDASVGVFRLSPGTGERLGGTWYLSLDGEASTRIDAGASAEEVSAAVTNLTSAGNVTVTEITETAGYNGERSWVVTFLDWNDPNRTATPPIVTVGDEGLAGTGAAATLEAAAAGGSYTTTGSDRELEMPHLCAKAVVQLSSLLSSGYIDECVVVAAWQGSTSYAVPPFSFDANATSVETALEGVDPTALGPVLVSSEGGASASGGGVWNVTFVGNSEGRTPELQCASDADVQQVSESSCEAIGGSFSLGFGGNTTQEIAFNASALEVCVLTNSMLYDGSGSDNCERRFIPLTYCSTAQHNRRGKPHTSEGGTVAHPYANHIRMKQQPLFPRSICCCDALSVQLVGRSKRPSRVCRP